MNKNIYLFLTFTLLILTFAVTSGCGKYMAQYSAPTIISRNPVIGAGNVASGEPLWLKFSKTMDTSGTSFDQFMTKMKFGDNMTATATIYPELTPEASWAENDSKLIITNIFFLGTPTSNEVQIISSKEALMDVNGLYIPENTVLWSYTVESD